MNTRVRDGCLACNLAHRSAQDDGSCPAHARGGGDKSHTEGEYQSCRQIRDGHCGPEPGVGEEARTGPVQPLRSTEGKGQDQLRTRWVQQLHHSFAQACPKTGAPGRVVWPLLPVTQGPHRARVQAPCGRPPPGSPISPPGHLQCGPLWTAYCSWQLPAVSLEQIAVPVTSQEVPSSLVISHPFTESPQNS